MFTAINLRKLLGSLAVAVGAGILAGFFAGGAMTEYAGLVQPPLSPPGSVFPVVWTILYLMMGVALYLASSAPHIRAERKRPAYLLFGLQLFFNMLWTVWFFRFHLYGFSAVWLAVLLALVLFTTIEFWRLNRWAGIWMAPYLLWTAFALYLNLGIWILNS